VLAAIVVGAVWGLIDIAAMRRYRVIRRNDFIAACRVPERGHGL
jgi:hypothetical protein